MRYVLVKGYVNVWVTNFCKALTKANLKGLGKKSEENDSRIKKLEIQLAEAYEKIITVGKRANY